MTNDQRMRSTPLLAMVLTGILSIGAVVAHGAAAVEVRLRTEEQHVDIRVGGTPFTAYIWPGRLTKPVLFPIRTARGTLVTRGFPLEPRPGEREDHPHQVGLWFSYGNVNGVDFWNNSEALPPEQAAKMGTIRHRGISRAEGGVDRGRLEVVADWVMPDGSTVLEETTGFVFRGADDARSIDRVTTLLVPADGTRVLLADNKEGVLGLRVARALEEDVNGEYTSSEGLVGAAVWGTRARWVALAGRVDDEDVVLLILDHPANPGHPTYWHARGYGLFAANPLGQRVFSEGRQELNFALDPGESVVFRHRLAVLPGPLSVERAEAAWKAFVAEYPE